MISVRLRLVFTQLRPFMFEVVYPSILIIFGAVIMSLNTKNGQLYNSVSLNSFAINQEFRYSESSLVDTSMSKSLINQFFNHTPFTAIHEEFTSEGNIREQFEAFDSLLFKNYKQDVSYGSAYIKSIEKTDSENIYDLITFLDITSSPVLAYFTNFMLTSLIRDSTGDPEITLNLSYGTYPRSKILDEWLNTSMAIMTVISFSLAVGNITSAMAANLVTERKETIKHQQIISGASLKSYWISVFFVDSLKFVLPGSAFVIITYAMDFDVNYGWLLLILMVISILPFTYCLTFLFNSENFSRTVTSYIQFFMGGFMALIMFAFQALERGGVYIQIIKWVLRFQPGFSFCNALVQLTMKERVPLMPGENIYSLKLVGGDMLMLALTPLLYLLILITIESGILRCSRTNKDTEILDLDEDVIEEEKRIDHSMPTDYQVRVKNLRKVYNDRGIKKVAVQDLTFGVQYGE